MSKPRDLKNLPNYIIIDDIKEDNKKTQEQLEELKKNHLLFIELYFPSFSQKSVSNIYHPLKSKICMNKTIYIAGKVTGLPAEPTALKFKEAKDELEAKGFDVINPIELINNPKEDWDVAMNKCLEALEFCDAIYMLPCYTESKGAMIEHRKATKLGLHIYYELERII